MALRLRLHGRGFQSKRFHDLETASNTTLREPANFAPDRFSIDAVSLFTRPMEPYRFENAPLLKAFSKRPGFDNELEPARVNERCNRIETDAVTNETASV